MTITVRAAEPSDFEAIRETMAQPRAQAQTLQLPFPSLEMWKKRIADKPPGDHVLVAELDGKVVGNLGLHVTAPSPRRRHAGALGMVVHDAWHRRGVGTALMHAGLRPGRQLAAVHAAGTDGLCRQRRRDHAIPKVRL